MKNNKILRIIIFLLVSLFISSNTVSSASAATNMCPAGAKGPHYINSGSSGNAVNPNAILTGATCGSYPSADNPSIGDGKYERSCIGSGGCNYHVQYCTTGYDRSLFNGSYFFQFGCIEAYDENSCDVANSDPKLAGCRGPSQPQSAIGNIFGQITRPPELGGFGGNGSVAISMFLSNAVILIYSIAAIVLLFMILWGAFEWMVSGGEKEKLAAARQRILNAIIGIVLFAVAFAILSVIGQFTGFKFFG